MSKRRRKRSPSSKSSLVKEIDELSKEISGLETQCELKEVELAQKLSFQSLDEIVKKLSDLQESSISKGEDENAEKTQEEIENLIIRKGKLEALTGFVFEEDRSVLVSSIDDNNNGSNVEQWRRILKGHCLGLSFEVDFVTEQREQFPKQGEVEEEKQQQYAEVMKLDVKIEHLIAQSEMESFLTKVKQENSLGNFLQVLPRYVRHHNCRKKTFLHFKTKYPEFVYLLTLADHCTYMEICNRQKSGIQFTICWDIHVESSGNIIPQLDCFASCTEDIGDDDDSIVKSTPEMFRKILAHYGIERAIELLISVVND